jgi:thioredoxin-dependent peroxiredoxin
MIEAGKKAPAFSLKDDSGRTVKLGEFAGKYVVLYFYPKDDTPGCTKEACSFRDRHAKLEAAGAVVLGVSPDNEPRHAKFKEKYQLPFTLLADAEHSVAEKYGAWGEKHNYGKKYFGIMRSTFLIGPDGKVARVWPKVKPEGHADEVLEAIRSIE